MIAAAAALVLMMLSAITASAAHREYKDGNHTAGLWLSNASAFALAVCAFGLGMVAACGGN